MLLTWDALTIPRLCQSLLPSRSHFLSGKLTTHHRKLPKFCSSHTMERFSKHHLSGETNGWTVPRWKNLVFEMFFETSLSFIFLLSSITVLKLSYLVMRASPNSRYKHLLTKSCFTQNLMLAQAQLFLLLFTPVWYLDSFQHPRRCKTFPTLNFCDRNQPWKIQNGKKRAKSFSFCSTPTKFTKSKATVLLESPDYLSINLNMIKVSMKSQMKTKSLTGS